MNLKNKVYVVLGDGECNEGSVWAAAMAGAHYKLDYLIAGNKPTIRKLNEAKNLNIKIITQTEFLRMLNIKDS